MLFEVANYQAHTRLGAGSQGETFLAADMRSGRTVALKRLKLATASDWKSVELFEREGAVLARLDHPGVARFHEAFRAGDGEALSFFIAQEYIEGESLDRSLVRGERLGEPELRGFLRQMADILDHLHTRNPPVVHRDLKPSNVMRRAGLEARYVVIDFGAGQFLAPHGPSLEGGSTIVGTSGYMPPEQLLGRTGPASDLYALGATAIHLLTGVHPSDMALSRLRLDWRRHATDQAVSEALAALLDALIAPALEDRIPSARALVQALLDAPASPRSAAIGHGGRVVTRADRRRALKIVAGTFGTIGGALGVSLLLRPQVAAPPVEAVRIDHIVPTAFADFDETQRRDALPVEDGYPCDIPVTLAVEPALAKSLGEAAVASFLADVTLTPRALRVETYTFDLRLLMTYRGAQPIGKMAVVWRVLDAANQPLASIAEEPVPDFAAPLRSGDVLAIGVQHYPDGVPLNAARVVGEVTALRVAPPDSLGEAMSRPQELHWKVPVPRGVDLKVRLLSDDGRPPTAFDERRLSRPRFELLQAGTAVIRSLKLLLRLADPAGSKAPVTKTLFAVFGPGHPSLRPGERRIFSSFDLVDPALTELELEVLDVDAVSTEVVVPAP